MEYIKLFWEGVSKGEPPAVPYEVDIKHERLTFRSTDIFTDGRAHSIPNLCDGAIEVTPIPTVEEFSAYGWGEEFHACLIEKTEFETVWESHTYSGALKQSGGI